MSQVFTVFVKKKRKQDLHFLVIFWRCVTRSELQGKQERIAAAVGAAAASVKVGESSSPGAKEDAVSEVLGVGSTGGGDRVAGGGSGMRSSVDGVHPRGTLRPRPAPRPAPLACDDHDYGPQAYYKYSHLPPPQMPTPPQKKSDWDPTSSIDQLLRTMVVI